jgi:hypothetical protein
MLEYLWTMIHQQTQPSTSPHHLLQSNNQSSQPLDEKHQSKQELDDLENIPSPTSQIVNPVAGVPQILQNFVPTTHHTWPTELIDLFSDCLKSIHLVFQVS